MWKTGGPDTSDKYKKKQLPNDVLKKIGTLAAYSKENLDDAKSGYGKDNQPSTSTFPV